MGRATPSGSGLHGPAAPAGFRHRLLDPSAAADMRTWRGTGGFSVDGSVRIESTMCSLSCVPSAAVTCASSPSPRRGEYWTSFRRCLPKPGLEEIRGDPTLPRPTDSQGIHEREEGVELGCAACEAGGSVVERDQALTSNPPLGTGPDDDARALKPLRQKRAGVRGWDPLGLRSRDVVEGMGNSVEQKVQECLAGPLRHRPGAGKVAVRGAFPVSGKRKVDSSKWRTGRHAASPRGPLESVMAKRLSCHISQEACPFPTRFAEPAEEPGYAARGPGERPVGVEVEAGPSPGVSHERLPESSCGPLHPGTDAPSLIALLEMALDPEAWEAFSRGSAIRRAGRAGFARNVCVALGNWGAPEAVPVLARALADPEPLVRGHAAWALGRVGGAAARKELSGAASSEEDAWVRAELEDARSKAG